MSTDKMSTDIMSNRQNVEQTKCRTDKMSTDKMSNRQNVDRQNVELLVFLSVEPISNHPCKLKK